MTRLDQAFIRAYRKSNAPAGPHLAPSSLVSPTPEPGLPRRPEAIAPIAGAVTNDDRLDAEHVALEQPHWSSLSISTLAGWDLPGEPVATASLATPALPIETDAALRAIAELSASTAPVDAPVERAIARSMDEKIPIAGNQVPGGSANPTANPTPAPPPTPASQPREVLRAAFEVDNFLWPSICQKLLATDRAAWNVVADELAAAGRQGQKSLLVTSYHRGEGRTTLTLCLAQLLAERKLRVALVDADFRRPQVARQLKLLPACGWDEVLRAGQPDNESWIESMRHAVTLLPLRERTDSSGLIGNPRVKHLLQRLREQFDLVLLDSGSLEDPDDRELAALLGATAQIDAALVVRDVRSTSTDTLCDAQKCLDSMGLARSDVVENFA